MRFRMMLFVPLFFCLLLPGVVLARKCTSVLPPEVFAFFRQNPGDVDCSAYEYKFFDLNDDGVNEIAVTNYDRSGDDAGYFNFEIFQKQGGKWVHIATIPGRPAMLESTTNGYHDLGASMMGRHYVYGWDGHTYRDLAQMQSSDELTRNPAATPTPKPTPRPTPTPRPRPTPAPEG